MARTDWNAVSVDIPSGRASVSGPIFDPEYAALRATLLSLARDGDHLLRGFNLDHPAADSRTVLSFLRRIDQLDEQVARRELEPVRRWAQHLKCCVLALTADQ